MQAFGLNKSGSLTDDGNAALLIITTAPEIVSTPLTQGLEPVQGASGSKDR